MKLIKKEKTKHKMKNIELGKNLRKLNEKDLFVITSIFYLAIILIYELFYCNYEFFMQKIQYYNFSFYRIIAYIFVYIIYIKFGNKFINSAIKSFENDIKCYVVDTVLMFTTIFSIIFIIICNINQIFNLRTIILFISILLVDLFVIYTSNNIYKNIIITSLVFGSIFSITITFNNQLDEKRHFLSSYSIGIGNLNLKDATIDESVASMPRQMNIERFVSYFREKPTGELTKDFSNRDIKDTPNNFYYYTTSYFVSGIGIFISKTLGGSIADIYITGRIFNLLGYTALVILALKVLPYKKYIAYAVLAMPMLLALRSSLFTRCNIYSIMCIIYSILFKT